MLVDLYVYIWLFAEFGPCIRSLAYTAARLACTGPERGLQAVGMVALELTNDARNCPGEGNKEAKGS